MNSKDVKFKRRTTRSHTLIINFNPNDYKLKKDESVDKINVEIDDLFNEENCTKKVIADNLSKKDIVKLEKNDQSSFTRSMVCGILGQQLEKMKKSVHFACRDNWPYFMYFRGCIKYMEDELEANTNIRKSLSSESLKLYTVLDDEVSKEKDFIESTDKLYSRSVTADNKLLVKENTKILKDITNTYNSNVDKIGSSRIHMDSNMNIKLSDSCNISLKEKIKFFENLNKTSTIEKTNNKTLDFNRNKTFNSLLEDDIENPAINVRSYDFKSLLKKWENSSKRKI